MLSTQHPKIQDFAYARGIGQLISLRNAANLMDCSVDRARYLENMGELGPTYKIGASLRVTKNGVWAYQKRTRQV
jgi:hypothetical protein